MSEIKATVGRWPVYNGTKTELSEVEPDLATRYVERHALDPADRDLLLDILGLTR